ncbi:unnamed protein product [Blepharisma stoltei]|uniref:Uncharacterized protein n=1 Tax=Blepharisma stoltei TaxID=1481888 RepID=A0AAU9IFZ4_9CILI|nr:unnamed protein product [Blepharisma stoltei]
MGVLDPFKETLESWKSSLRSSIASSRVWVKSEADKAGASLKSALGSAFEQGSKFYKQEKEDVKALYQTYKPEWLGDLSVIREKRAELLRDYSLGRRTLTFVSGTILVLCLSRGIRPKIKNTLLYSLFVGSAIAPEVISPF